MTLLISFHQEVKHSSQGLPRVDNEVEALHLLLAFVFRVDKLLEVISAIIYHFDYCFTSIGNGAVVGNLSLELHGLRLVKRLANQGVLLELEAGFILYQ